MADPALEPCPFCGKPAIWKTETDSRSAEMVGPHRVIRCSSEPNYMDLRRDKVPDCPRPRISYHTDGPFKPGKGWSTINRDEELALIWNTRHGPTN